jgi:thiol-disulfide isomerase/thioredoxin
MFSVFREFQPMPTAQSIYASQNMVRELNDSNFWNIFYDPHKVLVVDFWATWCPPCNDVAAAVVEAARRCYKGPQGPVKFYHVQSDATVNPKLDKVFGFPALPVVYFYYTSTGRPPTRSAPLLEASLGPEEKFREPARMFVPEEYLARIRSILRRHGHPVGC